MGTYGATHGDPDTVDQLAPWELGNMLQHLGDDPIRLWTASGLKPGGLGLDFDEVTEVRVLLEQRLDRRRIADADPQRRERLLSAGCRKLGHSDPDRL
jgi:hypothetical protein